MISARKVLKAALLTSLASKFSGLFYQIFAIPMILNALGGEGFGLFILISGFSTWLNLVSSGVAPMLTTMVARGDSSRSIQNSFIATNIFFLIIFLLLIFILQLFFSNAIVSYLENIDWTSIVIVYSLLVANIIFSSAESITQGRHKQHVNNLVFCFGSLLNLLFVYVATVHYELTDVVRLFVVSQLGLTLIKFINWSVITVSIIRYKLTNPFSIDLFRSVFSITGPFLLVQLSVVLFQQALIVIVYGHSKEMAGMLGLVFRAHGIMGSFLGMINQPMWPLVVDAIKNGNPSWVKKIYIKLMILYSIFGISCLIGLVLLGNIVFEYWSADKYSFSQLDCFWIGMQFFLISLTQANNAILMGLSEFKFLGRMMLGESMLALLLIVAYLDYFSIILHEIIMISCLVYLITSFWIAPKKLFIRLAQ